MNFSPGELDTFERNSKYVLENINCEMQIDKSKFVSITEQNCKKTLVWRRFAILLESILNEQTSGNSHCCG